MSLELVLRRFLSSETEETIKQEIKLHLKKNPHFCICCSKHLTVEDVLSSQGYHCKTCFQNLPKNEEVYLCHLHPPKEKKPHLICDYILRPLKNGEWCNLECERGEYRR